MTALIGRLEGYALPRGSLGASIFRASMTPIEMAAALLCPKPCATSDSSSAVAPCDQIGFVPNSPDSLSGGTQLAHKPDPEAEQRISGTAVNTHLHLECHRYGAVQFTRCWLARRSTS